MIKYQFKVPSDNRNKGSVGGFDLKQYNLE